MTPPTHQKNIVTALALASVILLIYGNSLTGEFHFDDIPSILHKPWIRGLDKIPQFIFSITSRPAVILTFNLNYAVSGFATWSYHAFNTLAHAGVTLLVWIFARAVWRAAGRGANRGGPFLAALIFAVHPLNTQAVTYISSRSSLLAAFFYLAAMLLLLQSNALALLDNGARRADAVRAIRWPYLLCALPALLLGGLAKEIIFTLPAMLALYHYFFMTEAPFVRWLRANAGRLALLGAAAALLLLAGIYLLMPLTAQGLIKSLFAGKMDLRQPSQYSSAAYFLTQTFVIPLEYLRKMLWPFNLSIEIEFPLISDWSHPGSYSGAAFLAALLWVGWRAADRRVGYGVAWLFITLLPDSSVVPLLDLAVEHRAYLPLIGYAMLAAAACEHSGAWLRAAAAAPRWRLEAWRGGMLCALLCLAALTVRRNFDWQSEAALWGDAKSKAPRVVRPYNNLGEAYDKLGQYGKAIAEFEAALALNPDYVIALNNLGNVYGKLENYARSAAYFRRALALKTDYAPAYYNLARALTLLGEKAEALAHYRRATEINPYFEEAHFNQAHLATELGHFQEAIAHYREFLQMQPQNAKAHVGLGTAYIMDQQHGAAIAAFEQATRLDPGYFAAHLNLATANAQAGKFDAAIAAFEDMLRRFKPVAGVHKNLGLIYMREKRDPAKATAHFQKSLELEPNQADAPALRAAIAGLQATP